MREVVAGCHEGPAHVAPSRDLRSVSDDEAPQPTATIILRHDHDRRPGGDVVQADELARGASAHGVPTTVSRRAEDSGGVVHALNLTRSISTWEAYQVARTSGRPFALTPIWHSLDQMARFYGRGLGSLAARFPITTYLALKEPLYERRASALVSPRTWRRRAQEMVAEADAVMANSDEELETLAAELGVRPGGLVRTIPNGADLSADRAPGPRLPVVLFAGRLEPRKNVLALCHAFRSSRLAATHELHLVGSMPRSRTAYAHRLRRQIDGRRIVRVPPEPHQDLLRRLTQVEVVALPSYFETTGLAALEGLFAGCQVVMSTHTYGREYFRGFVHPCDPHDERTIVAALDAAEDSPKPAPGPDHFARFSWDTIGSALADLYRELGARAAATPTRP